MKLVGGWNTLNLTREEKTSGPSASLPSKARGKRGKQGKQDKREGKKQIAQACRPELQLGMTHKTDEALAIRKRYGIAGRGEAREFTGLKTRRYSKMLRNREKSSGQWRVGLRVRSG